MENQNTLRLIRRGASCEEKIKILLNTCSNPVEYLLALSFQKQADALGISKEN